MAVVLAVAMTGCAAPEEEVEMSQPETAAYAVVQKVSGTVGFYTGGGVHIKNVAVGDHPHEGVLAGSKLYVTDNGVLWMTNPGEGGNTISIVDVNSMERTGVIDLGGYKRPRSYEVRDELPRTDSGKLLKRVLRDEHWKDRQQRV